MKVLFLTNNKISEPAIHWLEAQGEQVHIWSEKITNELISDFFPDIILSYNYRYLIREEIIEQFKDRIINMHISYLPWNRGADPNIWSFLEDTPKGVSIHLIDAGIDTGDILLQEKMEFDPSLETLHTSYHKLHERIQDLFIRNWDRLSNYKIPPQVQKGNGSEHKIRDLEEVEVFLGALNYHEPVIDIIYKYQTLRDQ